MASGNMKDIKRRIKSVESTMQITKAMELVSSSKMRRAKERVDNARPYFNELYTVMCRMAETSTEHNIYLEQRKINKSLYIVIAGDRGLAGGYNSNMFKLASEKMRDKNACVVTIGKKAMDYYAKRDIEVLKDYPNIAEDLRISDTTSMIHDLFARYNNHEIQEIFICYTHYLSPLVQEPHCVQLLPLTVPTGAKPPQGVRALTEYDPSPEAVFREIIPECLKGMLYGAVVESFASEQSARRVAMEAASDNAKEMIDGLNLSYNRARQGAITQEITEIVAGSGQVGTA